MKKLIFIIIVLFLITLVYVFNSPKEITIKDLHPTVIPHTSTKEPAMREPAVIDSSETDGKDKVHVDYYIIVESFRNLTLTQQKAEKLKNDFNTNIIVLPSLKDGYYRISYGKYSTFEEAKATIKSVRTNINSDAWIFSVKE